MLTTTLAAPPPYPYTPLEDDILGAGLIVFAIGSLIELAFLIHYVRVAPAFKSWIGVMFVLRSSSSLLAGVAILLGRILGPFYPGRPWLTLVLFTVVMLSSAVTYGTFLFERYGRDQNGRGQALIGFARRALGLRATKASPCEPAEPRPDTRPLRIVGGTDA